jgi:hypothetical protein
MLAPSLPPIALSLYLLVCALISAFALSSFGEIIQQYLSIQYSFATELFMVIGQVGFQWLFMLSKTWADKKSYMVVALTVSVVGSLMLLPLILFHSIYDVPSLIAVIYFFTVVVTIFALHFHLIQKLRLPKLLTITWVIYRLLLLSYVVVPRS